jgi:hypothetical protein
MKVAIGSLLLLLVLSNLAWFDKYQNFDRAYMQRQGLRDEADTLLRKLDPSVYNLSTEQDCTDGCVSELVVTCRTGNPYVRQSIETNYKDSKVYISCLTDADYKWRPKKK